MCAHECGAGQRVMFLGVCFVAYLGYQFVYLLVSCFEYGTFSNGGSMDSCDATHDGNRVGHYLHHKQFKKSRVELANRFSVL